MTSQITYPYDPTGKASTNLVTDLPHTLTPVQGKGHTLIVPRLTPFYQEGFKLIHAQSGKVLRPNVDYIFTHYILDMSHSLGNHLFGSVTVTNPQYMGGVVPSYQTIGGEFPLNETELANAAIWLLEADGAYSWNKLNDVPSEFPVDDHELPMELTKGYDDLVEAVQKITYGNEHMHEIHQVRFLDDVLRNKMDINGTYKVLADRSLRVTKDFVGSIGVRLPKMRTQGTIMATLQIVEADGRILEFVASGQIHQMNDGSIPETWANWKVKPSYQCWEGDFYLSYDSEHYPTIYLGKERNWNGCHISIINFFMEDADVVDNQPLPFWVSQKATLIGLEYENTRQLGLILTPSKGDEEILSIVNQRYKYIIPEGIHDGFTIAVNNAGQIQVGSPTERSTAVIYQQSGATTAVLPYEAQLLPVTEAFTGYVVLRLLDASNEGDARFILDNPNVKAEIVLATAAELKDGTIILATVNYPDRGVPLDVSHVTLESRKVAVYGGMSIEKVSSV